MAATDHKRTRVVHFKARREKDSIVLTWDVRHRPPVRWRVLRSEDAFAEGAFDDTVVGRGQTLVADGDRSGARDQHIETGATYFYAVFAENRLGEWMLAAKAKLVVDDPRLARRAVGDFEAGGPSPGPPPPFPQPPPQGF